MDGHLQEILYASKVENIFAELEPEDGVFFTQKCVIFFKLSKLKLFALFWFMDWLKMSFVVYLRYFNTFWSHYIVICQHFGENAEP